MGTQKIQGRLWGKNAIDWAAIQEQTSSEAYRYALQQLQLSSFDQLLDVGCGAGMFCSMAAKTGAQIKGIDASPELINIAQNRVTSGEMLVGDMEELPYANHSFDVVTSLQSFHYAGNMSNAVGEAKRVLKNNGTLVALTWGPKEACDAVSYFNVVTSLLPPDSSGTLDPFGLSEYNRIDNMLKEERFSIENIEDVSAHWIYPDRDIALRGLLSGGTAARAIEHRGYETVAGAVWDTLHAHEKKNGQIVYKNVFRLIIASNK
ncbi:MAG: hypothetical protein C5B59_15665 [Bacteroidetes bacterium]|nr:MAG: hypothetical protein C5B59_15665 [Bacteroidota bacterium]